MIKVEFSFDNFLYFIDANGVCNINHNADSLEYIELVDNKEDDRINHFYNKEKWTIGFVVGNKLLSENNLSDIVSKYIRGRKEQLLKEVGNKIKQLQENFDLTKSIALDSKNK